MQPLTLVCRISVDRWVATRGNGLRQPVPHGNISRHSSCSSSSPWLALLNSHPRYSKLYQPKNLIRGAAVTRTWRVSEHAPGQHPLPRSLLMVVCTYSKPTRVGMTGVQCISASPCNGGEDNWSSEESVRDPILEVSHLDRFGG